MRQLNVCKVIDQFGWAYYFVGMEQRRFSKHNVTLAKYDQVQFDNLDIMFIHSPNITVPTRDALPMRAKQKGIKVIGGYGAYVESKYSHVDAIQCISPQTYEMARRQYPDKPVIFLPECIDTDYFTPGQFHHERFVVGFAGRNHPVKRMHLLDRLAYPIKKKVDWGVQYFIERGLDDMRDFYKSIDVLVLTSQSECCPRVVLEAMACGLPIVSTAVGCVPNMIAPNWCVAEKDESAIVQSINEKLSRLELDATLRELVGVRNRSFVQNSMSWRDGAHYRDLSYEMMAAGDLKGYAEVGKDWIARLGYKF